MNNQTTYNGWTNYETWNVALWIDNEQGEQEYWSEGTQEVIERHTDGDGVFDKNSAIQELADLLEDSIEENAPKTGDMYADILNAALSEVDYREIATNWIEDKQS